MIVRASRCITLRVQRKMIWKLRESLERVVLVVGQSTLPPANLKLCSVFSNQPVSKASIDCSELIAKAIKIGAKIKN